MAEAVQSMPMSVNSVVMCQLYFVILPEFEGELRVGIGRPEPEEGVEEGRRSTWSNDPDRPGFKWSGTPMLVAARHGVRGRGAHMRNTEPLSSFLSLPVKLTGSS
eukprot:888784-Pleurochrysis_carterae.AAC.1